MLIHFVNTLQEGEDQPAKTELSCQSQAVKRRKLIRTFNSNSSGYHVGQHGPHYTVRRAEEKDFQTSEETF